MDDMQSLGDHLSRRSFLFAAASLSTTFLGLSVKQSWALDSPMQPFSFAYISGCHLAHGMPDSYKLNQESQLFLQDALKQINSIGVDFVVFGGDQVDSVGPDEQNWQFFLDVAQSLNCPWQFVLGESDISGRIPTDKLATFARDWKGKGMLGDKPYWSMDLPTGAHLIGLDTAVANTTRGYVAPDQLAWLKDDLAKAPGKLTIVISHHPLLAPAPYDSGTLWDDFLLPQAASIREILNTGSGVKLVVSGHTHVSKIERENQIWYVSSPSLDVYPCSFRIFRVDHSEINVETYQVNYPALVKKARANLGGSRLAVSYNSSKPNAFGDIARGDKLDNDATLPLTAGGHISAHRPEKLAREKK
jgi:3',5'-cyclic AMP phosphodiesterase CpdA